MITYEDVAKVLGERYDPDVAYVLAEKDSTALRGKLVKGYRDVGRIAGDVETGRREMRILEPPRKEKVE